MKNAQLRPENAKFFGRYKSILYGHFVFSWLVCLCIVGLNQRVNAQARIDLGIRLGMNVANEMALSNSTEQSLALASVLRATIGLQLDNWFSDHWAVSAQLLYDQRGSQRTYESLGFTSMSFTSVTEVRLNYLDLSVAIKGQLGQGVVRPYFTLGPSIGFLLSSSTTSTRSGDEIYEFAKTDVGILLGMGTSYSYDAATSFLLDASYRQGLSGLVNRSTTNYSVVSSTFRLSAGIMFRLGS